MAAERRFVTNGLVTFAQGLVGMKVFAELRAGTIAFGILVDCDHYLNLRIRNAIVLRARKAERFEEFFVSGRHLRYIHLAHFVDTGKMIQRASKSRQQQVKIKTRKNRTPSIPT